MYAQLEQIDKIQNKRKQIWQQYYEGLKDLEEKKFIGLPIIPEFATNNAHMFYIICRNLKERSELISFLITQNIYAVFHYQSLHESPFYNNNNNEKRDLLNSSFCSYTLLRLPMFFDLTKDQVQNIVHVIQRFFKINEQ